MVIIRLARGGSKKRPFYYVTVADSRFSKNGRFIERIGYYNPEARGQEKTVFLKKDRMAYWLSQGAQTTDRVKKIVKLAALPDAAA